VIHCIFIFRLAVLGKLNNFVKEWISEISESKVGHIGRFAGLLTIVFNMES
jgi:hypothetical protein